MYNSMTPYLRRALSNMIGNTAFSFGDVIVQYGRESNSTKERTEKKTLFATTPDRGEYPRIEGSEIGFHLNVLYQWDPNLAMEMIYSYLNSMLETGYIPAEQIRGAE